MGEAAVAAARAVGYVGAGTVEFIAEGRRILFHGDEHAAAGRASGDRGDHRHSTWSNGSCASPPARRCRCGAGRMSRRRPCHRGAALRRGPGARLPAGDRDAAPAAPAADAIARVDDRGARGRCGDAVLRPDDRQADRLGRGSRRRRRARLAPGLAETAVARRRAPIWAFWRGSSAIPDFAAGAVDTGFIERRRERLLPPPAPAPDAALAAAALWRLRAREAAASAAAAARATRIRRGRARRLAARRRGSPGCRLRDDARRATYGDRRPAIAYRRRLGLAIAASGPWPPRLPHCRTAATRWCSTACGGGRRCWRTDRRPRS